MEIQTPRPLVSPDQEGTKDPVARPVGSHGSNAPTYTIPPRKLGAVEHPMVIKDLEKAVETFGQTHSFKQVSSPQPSSSARALHVRVYLTISQGTVFSQPQGLGPAISASGQSNTAAAHFS